MESPNSLIAQPPHPHTPTPNPHFAGGVWLLALAMLLVLCGLCSALFYVVLPFVSRTPASGIQSNVIFGSTAGFGLVFGVLIFWQGLNAVRGRGSISAARAFPHLIVFVFAFLGAILLGLGALAIQPIAAYAFPPWHFIAALLPPLGLLAYGAHRLGQSSGLRALLVSFSWGALVATSVAFIVEILIALVLVIVAAVIITSLPNSRALLEQMQAQLRLAQRTQDFSALSQWFAHPAVMAGVLVYFAVIVPPLEEAVKALVVAFINPKQTRAADAMLWGMAAGAGFAVIENMFNASVALMAWAPLVLLRVGAAIVHVANGANMGRGWYAARVEGRWGQLFIAYLVSVLYHALWNGTAIVLSNNGLTGMSNPSVALASTILTGALLLVLLILASLGLVWIVYQVSKQRKENA
ncbi:MAG: PrsW family intramembrane metalloprotease [Chloroflexi bacterium]|nr:PrsW family intramembrane metalloprotease [Chloroflexota bacterium]